jgi:large subunit ribosomal protein L15
MRGSRTCGGGNPKKRRGGGNKGGRGLAGSGKNKKTKADYVRKNFPGHLGRSGFKRPQKIMMHTETMNVNELDQNCSMYVEKGLARKKGDIIIINVESLGVSKVLGTGKVTQKFDVSAPAFSESAVKKIEEKGGTVHVTG